MVACGECVWALDLGSAWVGLDRKVTDVGAAAQRIRRLADRHHFAGRRAVAVDVLDGKLDDGAFG